MSFAVAAGIMAGGSIIGGAMGASASRSAMRQQLAALKEARGEISRAYEESKGYYTPYAQAGEEGLNRLRDIMNKPFSMSDLQLDPGYQFRLKEGLKGIEGTAAARGGLLSGATMKGAQRYGQEMASQEYGNAYNRYLQLPMYFSGMGERTAGARAGLSSQYGSNIANLMGQGGQAQAAGTMGAANAWSNALSGVSNAAGSYMMAKAMR